MNIMLYGKKMGGLEEVQNSASPEDPTEKYNQEYSLGAMLPMCICLYFQDISVEKESRKATGIGSSARVYHLSPTFLKCCESIHKDSARR